MQFPSQRNKVSAPKICNKAMLVQSGVCENKATRASESHGQSIPLTPISMLTPVDDERAEPAKKRPQEAWQEMCKILNIDIGARGSIHCRVWAGARSGFIFANTGSQCHGCRAKEWIRASRRFVSHTLEHKTTATASRQAHMARHLVLGLTEREGRREEGRE